MTKEEEHAFRRNKVSKDNIEFIDGAARIELPPYLLLLAKSLNGRTAYTQSRGCNKARLQSMWLEYQKGLVGKE